MFSVSVDTKTRAALKRLAKERHHGNVSALITELVEEQERLEAGRRFLRWAGFKGLSDERRDEVDTEIANADRPTGSRHGDSAPRRKRRAA